MPRHKDECGANTQRGCRENCGCWCHDKDDEGVQFDDEDA